MKLPNALIIAEAIKARLAPHCERIEIAGSIRRKKPEVKDIELVCIAKPYEVGMFATGIAAVVDEWPVVKGHLPCKYTQRILPEGIKLDLFFAEKGNWGAIFLIRTGSWEFSKRFMGSIMPSRGYLQRNGWVTKNGKPIAVLEEADLFDLMGMEFIEPEKRA